MYNIKNREEGFTLLELMIAVLLLGLVLVPMLDLFSMSGKISTISWFELTAANLAQSKLEEIKDLPFNSVTSNSGNFLDKTDYSYEVTVIPDPEYPAYLKIITATVHYSDPGGNKSVSLTMEKLKR